MELAGDIVQELCDFLNISELSSTADFPHEFDALQTVLAMVCYLSLIYSVTSVPQFAERICQLSFKLCYKLRL